MRIVIVGATGNVGTSLIDALAGEDQVSSVVGLARRKPNWNPLKTTWAQADITSDDLVAHFKGADAVVHLAWLFQPTHSPLITWQNNVEGSIRVFKATAEAKVPVLVYASSVGAYSRGPKDRAVDESWPTNSVPTAAYGREKAYVERVLDTFERDQSSTRVVRLRPGFIFKRESASQQRRLFAGPLIPNPIARDELIPVIPDLPYFHFQALHSSDAGEAYRLAVLRPVRGPFNIAADPVIDPQQLAEIVKARLIKLPRLAVRWGTAAAWRLRIIPASPYLLDLVGELPTMDTTRARTELGWSPGHSAVHAIEVFLEGLREAAGMDTPPLDSKAGGLLRGREIATGVGGKP